MYNTRYNAVYSNIKKKITTLSIGTTYTLNLIDSHKILSEFALLLLWKTNGCDIGNIKSRYLIS